MKNNSMRSPLTPNPGLIAVLILGLSPLLAIGQTELEQVADTTFSHDRGYYDAPFTVSISSDTIAAEIYYTLDGSSPIDQSQTPTGHLYTQPILIETTTCLRAVAIKEEMQPTNVDTQTYIFAEHVLQQSAQPAGFPDNWGHAGADYEMSPDIVNDPEYRDTIKEDLMTLPAISLVMDQDQWFGNNGQGIYLEGEGVTKAVSAELIYPDGSDGFQLNCGVMIFGGSSTTRWKLDKLSMRLKFQGQYGPTKLEYDLFPDSPVNTFDTLVLDAHFNNSWAYGGSLKVDRDGERLSQREVAQYTRDLFTSDICNALGSPSPHGRHVHLYLNGLYWGLYWLHERPDEHYAAEHFGGQAEDYDVFKHTPDTVLNGTNTSYNQLLNLIDSHDGSLAHYQQIQAMLDIPSLMRYIIANLYLGNWDWDHHNLYATYNANSSNGRWRFHSWDAEHVMEALTVDITDQDTPNGPTGLHRALMQDVRYRQQFADEVHRAFANQGVLTPEGVAALYQTRLDQVDRAIVPESARWGDNRNTPAFTRNVEWVTERNWLLQEYFPGRTAIVLEQFVQLGWYPELNAPTLAVNGTEQYRGSISVSDIITLSAPTGEIWYCTDGNDPYDVNSASDTGNTTHLIPEDAAKKVTVGNISSNWTAPDFDDSSWTTGTGGVGYETSSGYGPYFDISMRSQMYNQTSSCAIRVPFTLSAQELAELGSLALNVRYDDGFVAYLNGEEIARANAPVQLTMNSSATTSHSDSQTVDLEAFPVSISSSTLRAGSNVLAIHGLNASNSSSDFLISVTLTSTENVETPAAIHPNAQRYTEAFTLDRSAIVKVRVYDGQTWSALTQATFAQESVRQNLRITELMYHPQDTGHHNDPNTEFIELANIGTVPIDLDRVQFTDGIRFTFGSRQLAARETLLLVAHQQAFIDRYGDTLPVAGQYEGRLSNGGETLQLVDAAGESILTFEYQDDWYDQTDGDGYSLIKTDPSTADPNSWSQPEGWSSSTAIGGTPGTW